ncbi:MAG: alpha/beta hydrolase [Promethearchaeota archaeon]|nr:MAG: alpha/beta hydrolase [Candidatus Lokiarchaeota archaeon]
MPLLKYKDKNIFYQIKEAETEKWILLIHGSGGNSHTWNNQLTQLDTNSNLVAIDLPSHDQSDTFSELSLELYVDVVKTLINNLNVKEVILAGHSLGGAVILSYYFKYPSEVSALILIGTGARLRVSPIILNSLKTNFQEFLDGLPMGGFYRKTPKEIINQYLAETSKIAPEVTYQDFKICDEFDVMDKIRLINVPCLIICGTEDRLTLPKYSKFFKENIENSEMVLINNAGHFIMLEKADELNQAIKEFIKKL